MTPNICLVGGITPNICQVGGMTPHSFQVGGMTPNICQVGGMTPNFFQVGGMTISATTEVDGTQMGIIPANTQLQTSLQVTTETENMPSHVQLLINTTNDTVIKVI